MWVNGEQQYEVTDTDLKTTNKHRDAVLHHVALQSDSSSLFSRYSNNSSTMAPSYEPTGMLKTRDGVTLAYHQSGPKNAPNILLIPGWSQTAAQWGKQIAHFGQHYRVTTYDHRNHGESEKNKHGMRITRLAADLDDLVRQLDLTDVIMMGHSMGSSVLWAYWDTFADSRERVKQFIFVDQPPVMILDPAWSEAEAKSFSAMFRPEAIYDVVHAISAPKGEDFIRGFVGSMFTSDIPKEDMDWVVEQNEKMALADKATLLLDHASRDWRDVIRTIDVPTLVVTGRASLIPVDGLEWIALATKGDCVVFEKEEGGSHFMFWENSKEFNEIVDKWIRGEVKTVTSGDL